MNLVIFHINSWKHAVYRVCVRGVGVCGGVGVCVWCGTFVFTYKCGLCMYVWVWVLCSRKNIHYQPRTSTVGRQWQRALFNLFLHGVGSLIVGNTRSTIRRLTVRTVHIWIVECLCLWVHGCQWNFYKNLWVHDCWWKRIGVGVCVCKPDEWINLSVNSVNQ